tara:strand:- start:258 stop:683 length:426 start_codon:yes stop_codon:yes gene_type:complete
MYIQNEGINPLPENGAKMRKGMTAKLNINECFTPSAGGQREFPAGTRTDDERGVFSTYRPLTEREVREWNESPASKGMNSAGETKLPPTCVSVEVHSTDTFTILRARCTVWLGYRKTGGMMEVRLRSGETTYIKRDMVIPA